MMLFSWRFGVSSGFFSHRFFGRCFFRRNFHFGDRLFDSRRGCFFSRGFGLNSLGRWVSAGLGLLLSNRQGELVAACARIDRHSVSLRLSQKGFHRFALAQTLVAIQRTQLAQDRDGSLARLSTVLKPIQRALLYQLHRSRLGTRVVEADLLNK